MRAADLVERLEQLVAVGKQVGDAGLALGEGEEEVLGRDVLVAERLRLLLGLLEDPDELLGGADVRDLVAAQRRRALDRLPGALAGASRRRRRAAAGPGRDAVVLLEQGEQQVGRRDLGVGGAGGEALGARDGLLGLDCEAVCLHSRVMVAALVEK